MRRVTGQKLKPIIIVWCCVYVALINCDENSVGKGSIAQPEVQRPGDESSKEIKPLASDTAKPSKPDSEHLNAEKNLNIDGEVSGSSSNGNKHSETNHVTSKNSTNIEANPTAVANSKLTPTTPKMPTIGALPQPINAGALQRGFYVFLGLSVIVIAYIIFRCTRLGKNRTQMVRKYGVLAHRQDVEMRPLPLDDEDEDDTTVFDASEIAVHDKRRGST